MKTTLFLMLIFALTLAGCGDSDKPSTSISDTTQVYSPQAMDDDDALLNEDIEQASSNISRCTTYTSTRMNSGRRLWKINKPLWKYYRYASVRFNSGFSVSRVVVGKANRINSGKGRGFVFRRGSTTPNIVAIWAPFSDKSTQVTVCGQ